MTVWRKLENEECYAVAIYNYTASTTPHLELEVGELVHLERETDEWYWGTSLRRDASGAFPKSYVHIRECNVERCGETVVASAGGSGVAHEIALTLREWIHHWKKLYLTNDDRFKFMEVSMRALLQLRGQAASSALPQDQLRKTSRTAIFTIDKGNRTLGMELAMRNSNGKLVNPLTMSTYRLNALHEETNMRIDKNMEVIPAAVPSTRAHPSGAARTYTLVVRVHNFVCRLTDAAELQLALHDSEGTKLTEHLLLRWPQSQPGSSQAVFTDLGPDVKRDKVFLVCHVVRIGGLDQAQDHRRSSVAQAPAPTTAVGVRRPFGVACGDVTKQMAADAPDKHVQLPFYPCEKEYMDHLLKKVIVNREMKDTKHTQGLWISLQLVEGNLKQIREENPHLVVGSTAVARKMGFPEVIMPGDARNDLYVTVCGGSFSKGGGKSSERNIELTARVVDRHGNTMTGVISIGAGVPLVDEYTSLVYYHDDRPRWQEVFKVCLNIEEFKEAHLVFLFRHRSSNEAKDRAEKFFALSYLRLMQREGTTTPDKLHTLCVYKIDNKRGGGGGEREGEREREGSASCVALPSRRDELPAGAERGLTRGVLALVHRDSLSVLTKLCSTKLTQREEILGVLKWGTQHAEGSLRAALRRLLATPSDELVKFLQDILDALFNILTQVPEERSALSEDSYAVLVLECLLCVISLVADHKYQHFQPVLHVYIDKSFCDALAYEKLIAVIVWVIQSADRGETELKRLLQCMKCLECLVRFIVRSRELRRALGDRAADDDFYYQFQSLMEAIIWLMRCGDAALTCQGSALKYLPNAIPHAIKVFPQNELSAAVVRALEALPLSRLGKQRMSSLLEIVRGPLCASASARATLLPHLAHTLAHLLRTKMELDREMAHKSRSVDKAARLLGADSSRLHDPNNFQHIVELCIETLGEVVTLLARDDIGPVESDRGDLARRLLPTVLSVTASMLRDRSTGQVDDALLRETVSVLLDMVRQMSAEQYSAVVAALEAEGGGAGSLVADALALMTALLSRPVFGAHWADMLHLQHSVMLHALKLLSTTLCERLQRLPLDPRGQVEPVYGMRRDWFNTLASVATSPVLQLETLSAARRQRALALYGDLRRDAAHTVSEMWYNLGEHKRAFIPCLVEPVLKVSFLRDEEVRTTTIPLLFDMMQTEYNYNVANGETEGHLRELESELIDKVDRLVERGCGDAAWRARFVALCGSRCAASGDALRQAAGALVAAAARQLDALLQYRAPHSAAAASLRMQLASRVLLFYEQIERPHMYIRYAHKLADMHRRSAQWAEAGLALRLHATLLAWTDEPLPQRLQRPTHCPARHATQRDLKEELYREVVDLLDRGHQWEIAVEIVKELVTVYEEESLGYGILAQLHETLARLYTAMLRTARMHPSYFRVIYYGKGFPDHLRVEEGFVYRGNEYEQLGDFKERLLDEWPEAEVLPKLDPPGEDITESDGQYFQINAVEPVMGDKLKRVSGKPIAEQILQYYKYNHVDKFIFSRPFHRPEESVEGSTSAEDVSCQNEFATRWLERTELEISDKLPGILRWFPVASKRTFWVSPLEAAVEALRNSNRDLKSLILGAKAAHAPLQPLTMRLSGILDPAVQGGVVNYERAFLTPAYEARHPDHVQLLQDLKDLIAAQIPLLKYGLEVHAARIPVELEALHEHMKTCFSRIQHHVHQRYGRKACELESESPEVQLRANLRDSLADVSSVSSNRISDMSTGTDSALKSKFFSFNSAINPLVRNSSGGVVTSYFNTLNTPKKKREQKRSRKSEVVTSPSSGSQWYTSSHSAPNGVATPTAASPAPLLSQPDTPTVSPLRELRQPLMTERPLRAEVERERRLSQRASFLTSSAPHSNRDSFGTTDSNQEEEEPPPLPQKSSHRSLEPEDNNNNNNNNDNPPRYNYDTVSVPRGSFLYSSMANRRHTTTNGNKPPTPPPKKKNAQNNP